MKQLQDNENISMSASDVAIAKYMRKKLKNSGVKRQVIADKTGLDIEDIKSFENASKPVPASVLFVVSELLDMKLEKMFDIIN